MRCDEMPPVDSVNFRHAVSGTIVYHLIKLVSTHGLGPHFTWYEIKSKMYVARHEWAGSQTENWMYYFPNNCEEFIYWINQRRKWKFMRKWADEWINQMSTKQTNEDKNKQANKQTENKHSNTQSHLRMKQHIIMAENDTWNSWNETDCQRRRQMCWWKKSMPRKTQENEDKPTKVNHHTLNRNEEARPFCVNHAFYKAGKCPCCRFLAQNWTIW